MAIFKLNIEDYKTSELDSYKFKNEGIDKISPQELIASFPSMILSIPEIEITNVDSALVIREFSTNRGLIDVIIITENADVILIETKLFRNPESHRTVVAQAIDYIKAFSDTDLELLKSQILKSKYSDSNLTDKLFKQDLFCAALNQNIKTGNFKVIIAGDKIHPNVLGMVESVQSAPHLAFTIYLVELCPFRYDDDNILFHPRVVTNTNEIERSVIKLEIDYKQQAHTIESSIPQKESKGSRPIITSDQFIDSLSKPEFALNIQNFWKDWEKLGGDLRFGTVGFSSGIKVGNKRIALQFVYNNRLALISENWRNSIGISDNVYETYKEKLKNDVPITYDYLIGNKVEISFDIITKNELDKILEAAIDLAKEIKKE